MKSVPAEPVTNVCVVFVRPFSEDIPVPIADNVTERLGFGAFAQYNNWEYFKDRALGSVTHPDTVKDQDPERLYSFAMMHVNNYIKAKILRHG